MNDTSSRNYARVFPVRSPRRSASMLEWRAGTDLRADPRCQLNDYAVAEARIPRNVPTVINLGRHHGVDTGIVGCDRGPKDSASITA